MHTRDKLRVIRVNTQALQRSIGLLQGPDDGFAARFNALSSAKATVLTDHIGQAGAPP